MYYVCNNPEPMGVPWGVGAKFTEMQVDAIREATQKAQDFPGSTFYVHEFTVSRVVFRAGSKIELDTEYLNGDSE